MRRIFSQSDVLFCPLWYGGYKKCGQLGGLRSVNTEYVTFVAVNGTFRHYSGEAIRSALSAKQGRNDCKRKDRDRAGNSYHGHM